MDPTAIPDKVAQYRKITALKRCETPAIQFTGSSFTMCAIPAYFNIFQRLKTVNVWIVMKYHH
jgi:hypothetical protein